MLKVFSSVYIVDFEQVNVRQEILPTRLPLRQWFSMTLNFEERKIDSLPVKSHPLTYDLNECKCRVNMHLLYVAFSNQLSGVLFIFGFFFFLQFHPV